MSSSETKRASGRFTLDGSDALEQHLALVCERVLEGVSRIVPARRLVGLVLGGGYGRGEGGVLKASDGDRAYNDLEFYVFTSGNRLLNDRLYRAKLAELGEQLSPGAGLHVEFKIDSFTRLRASTVSMFSYDLVSEHRVLFGGPELFAGCEHHKNAEEIPLSEATRLLFNRCTGLLLAREMLARAEVTPGQCDFIARNIAKAQLAVGDALLTVSRRYHWSCLERARRVAMLHPAEVQARGADPVWLAEVKSQHRAGVAFKLHPKRVSKPAEELRMEHASISGLAQKVWLWLENARLAEKFSSHFEYAFAPVNKCSDTKPWRNFLLNLNTFGCRSLLDGRRWRYPRERLLNALPLLLWNGDVAKEPRVLSHLQKELHTGGNDWSQLVAAYKQIWPSYG